MSKKTSLVKLLAIFFLFALPLFVANQMFSDQEYLRDRQKTNNGTLIVPPKPLPDVELFDPLGDQDDGKLFGKWTLFYITGSDCDEACVNNLYAMRQIRLTAGEHTRRVQRALFYWNGVPSNVVDNFENYAGQLIVKESGNTNELMREHFKLNDGANPVVTNRLYVIDPNGNLIMFYEPGVDPIGIIKDLSKLLRASRIG